MKSKQEEAKVIFGPVRLSYVHVFEPYAQNGGTPVYSVSVLIDKNDTDKLDAINRAIDFAKKEAKLSKWKGGIPKNLDISLRDGNDKENAGDVYIDKMYVNAKCKTKPGVVDRDRHALSEGELKSGDYGFVSMNFYGYSVNGKNGIACGLNNIMKHCDGPALGGRVSAGKDFEGIEPDNEADFDDDDELL